MEAASAPGDNHAVVLQPNHVASLPLRERQPAWPPNPGLIPTKRSTAPGAGPTPLCLCITAEFDGKADIRWRDLLPRRRALSDTAVVALETAAAGPKQSHAAVVAPIRVTQAPRWRSCCGCSPANKQACNQQPARAPSDCRSGAQTRRHPAFSPVFRSAGVGHHQSCRLPRPASAGAADHLRRGGLLLDVVRREVARGE
jgi:hypothetical protein